MTRRAPWLIALCLFAFGACGDGDLLGLEGDPPEEQRIPIENLLEGAIVVTKNPSGRTPLAVEVLVRTRVPTRVAIRVLGSEALPYEFEEAMLEHVLPIVGLYPGRENLVKLRVSDSDAAIGVDTLRIRTDPLPEYFPNVEIVVADVDRMEDGWTLSSLSIGEDGTFRTVPFMFDAQGNVRWFMDLGGMAFAIEPLANGNLLFGQGGAIYEVDVLGREVNRWEIPGYQYHHDVIEKPDGNLLAAVNKVGIETIEDHVIEIDRSTGAIVNEWDLRQVLDVDRPGLATTEEDWFHMNAIWYDAADDALILSGRNQGVVKVTRDNRLVWILAPHAGWGRAGADGNGHDTSDFLLTAVNEEGVPYPDSIQLGYRDASDFSWPWG